MSSSRVSSRAARVSTSGQAHAAEPRLPDAARAVQQIEVRRRLRQRHAVEHEARAQQRPIERLAVVGDEATGRAHALGHVVQERRLGPEVAQEQLLDPERAVLEPRRARSGTAPCPHRPQGRWSRCRGSTCATGRRLRAPDRAPAAPTTLRVDAQRIAHRRRGRGRCAGSSMRSIDVQRAGGGLRSASERQLPACTLAPGARARSVGPRPRRSARAARDALLRSLDLRAHRRRRSRAERQLRECLGVARDTGRDAARDAACTMPSRALGVDSPTSRSRKRMGPSSLRTRISASATPRSASNASATLLVRARCVRAVLPLPARPDARRTALVARARLDQRARARAAAPRAPRTARGASPTPPGMWS